MSRTCGSDLLRGITTAMLVMDHAQLLTPAALPWSIYATEKYRASIHSDSLEYNPST
jgi:hypothetical protein